MLVDSEGKSCIMERLPSGVCRRKDDGKLYFEVRTGEGKLYSAKIRSVEEGGLCHDITRLYYESFTGIGAPGGKRKAQALKLNYPDYSSALVLEDLPRDFASRDNKEQAMKIILKQARAAAMKLPERAQAEVKSRAKVQKHFVQDVGSQSIGNRNSSQQNAYNASRGAKEHAELGGVDRSNDVAKFLDVCEHLNQCKLGYTSKVNEREELERKVKDIKEDSGIISFGRYGPDIFHKHMACFIQLVGSDGKLSLLLEAYEQEYMSEESKCWKLRKRLEDHNLESITESLMGDGNEMTGCRRANEIERLLPVLEICPIEEQNHWSMPTGVSAVCAAPTSPLVLDHVMPCGENSIAMPSVVETDMSQPVAFDEFALGDKYLNKELGDKLPLRSLELLVNNSNHTGCRRENEDERPAKVCASSNAEVELHDQWNPDWTDVFYPHQGDLQSHGFISS